MNDTHNNALLLYWVSRFIHCYAEYNYAEFRYAERRYTECRYAECRDAMMNISGIIFPLSPLTTKESWTTYISLS